MYVLTKSFKYSTLQRRKGVKLYHIIILRVKAKVFLVVMYGCESWTKKKAEGRRIDAFEL